jgi:hypothetical protein
MPERNQDMRRTHERVYGPTTIEPACFNQWVDEDYADLIIEVRDELHLPQGMMWIDPELAGTRSSTGEVQRRPDGKVALCLDPQDKSDLSFFWQQVEEKKLDRDFGELH